jgi:hypothetical protein
MPAAVAVRLIVGGLTTGATIYAANKSSGAARNAARSQTDAANHAADLESQTAREQLEYERQQAAVDQQNFVATQNANYGQYASRERQLNTLGGILGLPPREIAAPPKLAPVVTPTPGSAAPPSTAGTLGATMGVTPATSATAATEASVQLRAPDGTVQAVPASQVDHYVARGATRV